MGLCNSLSIVCRGKALILLFELCQDGGVQLILNIDESCSQAPQEALIALVGRSAKVNLSNAE